MDEKDCEILDPGPGGRTEKYYDILESGEKIYIQIHKRSLHPALLIQSNSPRITLFNNIILKKNIKS